MTRPRAPHLVEAVALAADALRPAAQRGSLCCRLAIDAFGER